MRLARVHQDCCRLLPWYVYRQVGYQHGRKLRLDFWFELFQQQLVGNVTLLVAPKRIQRNWLRRLHVFLPDRDPTVSALQV